MTDTQTSVHAPEFHLVVKRASRRGPIAPYRLVITVAFALAVAGMPLWDAANSTVGVDSALLHVAGAGLFAWIVLGRVSAILGSASRPTPRVDEADDT